MYSSSLIIFLYFFLFHGFRVLNHPNIVGFRGLPATKDGRTTLAMESCDSSLGDILEKRKDENLGPLPAESILKVQIPKFY